MQCIVSDKTTGNIGCYARIGSKRVKLTPNCIESGMQPSLPARMATYTDAELSGVANKRVISSTGSRPKVW